MSQSKKKTRLFAILALAVAASAFALVALGGLGENLVYYWGPTELRQAGDKAVGATVRLGGQVVEGSIDFDEKTTRLAFEITDGQERVPVRSLGVPPQMFREGIGVIVEGTMTREGYFRSERLMVSHGNEYRVPEEGEEVDVEALIKSADASAEGR